ncbi:MAG: DUF2892 domain-containing protein [Gammaproteobacteria bacterium]|nr:DUF2892 domain-containing protein [Gammaproteobacteria bacterium]
MKIKRNLHTLDRLARLTIGVVCIYIGFFSGLMENQMVSVIIGIFGVINVYAFSVASCPVYSVCGISTVNAKQQETALNESEG